jgi:hypothetical protein
MKILLSIVVGILLATSGSSQSNRVFSGGEVINYGTIDISLSKATAWGSERSSQPGYFSLIESANYIGYSDTVNIDGYVKKFGNTAFVFPVGSGSDLRTLEISNPRLSTDAYATAWIEGDPSTQIDPTTPHAGMHSVLAVSGSIVAVSKAGQWDWQVGEAGNLGSTTTGNGEGLIITVSIPDMRSFAEASELRLVGWNGTSWVDLSGKSTATGNTENSKLIGTMTVGISAIAIGKIVSAPFVKLESFTATTANCNTILKWSTSFELMGIVFTIEQSTDSIKFSPIASIASSGLSNGSNYIKSVEPPVGKVYYRLKIQQPSGAFIYSKIISTLNECNENDNMWLYPNPVVNNDPLNLRVKTSREGTAELFIFNTLGQQMLRRTVQFKNGINTILIDVKHFIHGTYNLHLIDANGNRIGTVKRFIKQ